MKPPPKKPNDPYRVLGLERRATDAEIKRAYFALVRQHPPERDPERFQEIRAAYETLKNPEKRAATDLFLLQPPPEAPAPKRRSGSYNTGVEKTDLAQLAFELLMNDLNWHKEFREPKLP